jgi:glutamine cyclotransferase
MAFQWLISLGVTGKSSNERLSAGNDTHRHVIIVWDASRISPSKASISVMFSAGFQRSSVPTVKEGGEEWILAKWSNHDRVCIWQKDRHSLVYLIITFRAHLLMPMEMIMRNKVTALLLTLLCAAPPSVADDVVTYGYRVVAVYPHDRNAFTQGLFFRDGDLYESTGLRGHSSIRKVSLATGEVLRQHDLEKKYFGEGIVDWNDRLIAVTWKAETGMVFQLDDFRELQTFRYLGEGWGLTRNADNIIMSDGSDRLRFIDPETFEEVNSVTVSLRGNGLRNLNELEWIEGAIFANVWRTNWIVQIVPDTGQVIGTINLTGLLPESDKVSGHTDVLNGIAYDAETKRIFVTGKHWPKLFEIELVVCPAGSDRCK